MRGVTEPVVHLRVWHVPSSRIPSALGRMGVHRLQLRRVPGLSFAKLLGTGSGDSFTLGDADLHHWALLTVFADEAAAARFAGGSILRSWRRTADEGLDLRLRPLISRGRWAGQEPFITDESPARWDGPVAAITRARIRPQQWRTFWSSVPPVAEDLRSRTGVLLTLGIGEAPVGLQGTFSVWESNRALTEFAQRGAVHRAVIADTERLGWYSEELFARFAVVAASGTFNGRPIPAGPAAITAS
ncbi:MAG: hypothetical protein QG597_1614 [Actinomycetota bacterium]|nr:hypothetical protein [Actinomycetota bacterium]